MVGAATGVRAKLRVYPAGKIIFTFYTLLFHLYGLGWSEDKKI